MFVHFLNSNFLVISHYKWNQRTKWLRIDSYLMFSMVLAWLTLNFFSFVFVLGIYFSRKKLGYINVNTILPEKICCNFSHKNSERWELCMHPDYDHFYIPLTSKKVKFQPKINIFSGNKNPFSIKPSVLWAKISEKKHQFFPLKILLPQASK